MAHFGVPVIPTVPPMPPGQTDLNAWTTAAQNGWIVNPNLPLTEVQYQDQIAMTPPCDPLTSHVFTRRMLACPLTINGPPGSEPDGKASWWVKYLNVNTLGHSKRAWVQGHLLNHHIHGPGIPVNLVPITDQLNRIMERWAEKFVKDEILKKGHILKYEVTVNWLAGALSGQGSDWLGNASKHAAGMHQAFDNLKTGECLAPTSVSWEAWTIQWNVNHWMEVLPIKFSGYEGIENGIFYNNWN